MKLSSKALACGQSPMRKFHPYAVAAAAAGKKIYHLNIGQPDIHTPDALYDAIHNFRTPVLAYAASPGIPELIEAIRKYYENIGVGLDESDILITTGGSEALQIAANCLLDEGDEVIVPEPFYPNYHTFITTAGGVIHPLHTKPEEGYFYADRARIEACITPKTKAIMITNPGNPTGTCLTEAQMKMLLDVAVAHDLYLVADEVYREFTYDGEPLHSFGKFDYGQENLILIDSVSKRFSACGARIGCLISRNREFMANALKYCQARLSVATLDQITNSQSSGNRTLVFTLTGDIQAGQNVTLSIGQKSANYDALIPLSGLREDSNGKFVYVLQSKNSPLGSRYIATRVTVQELARDDKSAAVSGISQGDFIITTSNKPVEAGKQVRLADNG